MKSIRIKDCHRTLEKAVKSRQINNCKMFIMWETKHIFGTVYKGNDYLNGLEFSWA